MVVFIVNCVSDCVYHLLLNNMNSVLLIMCFALFYVPCYPRTLFSTCNYINSLSKSEIHIKYLNIIY